MAFVKIRITPGLLALFREMRVLTSPKEERLVVGEVMGLSTDARIERYGELLTGHVIPMGLGAFSYSHAIFSPEIVLGRYCSLAVGVEVLSFDHAMDWATTSPFTHDPFGHPVFEAYLDDVGNEEFRLHRLDYPMPITRVGHDVWIGMRTLLKRGVTIGHGAVIGAGSVVTHDVPPYAVVAGSPARLIRYRFDEPLIERFLALEWWRFGPDQLQPLDVRAPNAFLDRLEQAIERGLKPLDLPILTGAEIVAAAEPYA